MIKKTCFIFFVGLILVSGFVFASYDNPAYSNSVMKVIGSHTKANTNYSGLDSITYDVNITMHKGWNLVAGIPTLNILPNSEIQREDIYNFLYVNEQSKYIQVESADSFMTFLKTTPMSPKYYPYVTGRSSWVYSKKDGNLSYREVFPANPFLTKGWNFVSITPIMYDKNIGEFIGSCNIEKYATYDLYEGYPAEWHVITSDIMKQHNLSFNEISWAGTKSDAGKGIIVKVSSDCTFAESSGTIVPPPAIPN